MPVRAGFRADPADRVPQARIQRSNQGMRQGERQGTAIQTRLTTFACALALAAAPAAAGAAPLTLDINQGSYAVDIKGGGLALVGDVNGDGMPDTAQSRSDPNGSSCSALHITFRRGPDLADGGGFDISDSAPGCPGSALVVFPAGDVNGDGIGDLVAQTEPPRPQLPGRLYVVFGRPASGPVDLAQLGSRGFAIEDSPRLYGSPGNPLHVAHGDVNGDGLADLLIRDGSSSAARPPQVVFGKASDETVDLHDLGSHGSPLRRHPGARPAT
jgi:hypothetical protein